VRQGAGHQKKSTLGTADADTRRVNGSLFHACSFLAVPQVRFRAEDRSTS
jgi:hypothetical protein